MKKKNEIRGNLYIQMPQPFRRQQLSLSTQKKDKEIRLKLEELHKKRNEHQQLEQRWQKEKQNYNQFLHYHIQKQMVLKIKEEAIRNELFKLSIRKEQIESKINPQISCDKMKKLVQYLKCVPFTLGSYYEKVVLWKSQADFLKYKFFFNYFVDRVLQRTHAQRYIKQNVSSIVYCNKLKFQGEWLMVTLKIIGYQTLTGLCLRKGQGTPSAKKVFELSVYSIQGTYFCYKRHYKQEQLQNWADRLQRKQRDHKKHCSSRVDEARRVSMAQALAANAFKDLASTFIKESSPQHQKQVQNNEGKIQVQSFVLPKGMDTKTIQEENESQVNSNRHLGMHAWSQNSVQVSNPIPTYNEENSDSTLQREESVSSNDSSDEIEKTTEKESLSTKKNVKSKSFFYSQTKYRDKRFKALNKNFLDGGEQFLFPPYNPLLNIVILKQKNELYFLQDYLQIKEKIQIINIALSRFRLKMKMKKQLRKCIFYKVMKIQDFYQTKLRYVENITLPVIFMIKKTGQNSKQLKLSCTALQHHPNVTKGLNFSHPFYKQKTVTQKPQSRDNRRVSNNKLVKNSGRKSKDMKRHTGSKTILKGTPLQYQKSSFHSSKKDSQNFAAFIKQKFEEFMKDHVIWITKQSFIPLERLKNLSKCVVRLQAILKKKMELKRCKILKENIVQKHKYFPQYGILLTARATEDIRVTLQTVHIGTPSIFKCNNYPLKYKQTIFKTMLNFEVLQKSEEEYQNLELEIQQAIEIQDNKEAIQLQRKPAKQRQALLNFLRRVLLKKKTRANTFFIKRLVVKERLFVLIIRRDSRIKSLLQCNLYDFPIANLKVFKSRDTLSEVNYFKIHYPHSNKQLGQKSYVYQKIYLHERYFEGIQRKAIPEQFLIDYKVFLLKPVQQPSIYFMERLRPFDINYEEINKELTNMEKEEKEDFLNFKHSTQLSHMVSNKSIKNTSLGTNTRKSKENFLAVEKEGKRYNVSHHEARKLNKKISLVERNKEIFNFVKQNLMRQYGPQHTVQSVIESTGQKSKQGFKITGNSHDSVIYFSLYKAKDIFFYLDLYLVTRKKTKSGYSEQLEKVSSERLYKKQVQEQGNQVIIKKIAEWLHRNEERVVQMTDGKERIEQTQCKIEIEQGLSMVSRCLQYFDNNGKRFSQNILVNFQDLVEKQKQRGSRNNTLNL